MEAIGPSHVFDKGIVIENTEEQCTEILTYVDSVISGVNSSQNSYEHITSILNGYFLTCKE